MRKAPSLLLAAASLQNGNALLQTGATRVHGALNLHSHRALGAPRMRAAGSSESFYPFDHDLLDFGTSGRLKRQRTQRQQSPELQIGVASKAIAAVASSAVLVSALPQSAEAASFVADVSARGLDYGEFCCSAFSGFPCDRQLACSVYLKCSVEQATTASASVSSKCLHSMNTYMGASMMITSACSAINDWQTCTCTSATR
jgi:hypothetical protein